MKIIFVHIGRENLGIEYLSSVLKNYGFEVGLAYDPGLFTREDNVLYSPFLEKLFDQKEKIINEVEAFGPDVVAFSAYTTNYSKILFLARQIKSKINVPTVFGGIHATLVPDEVIRHDCVDFLIRSEGEGPLLELLISLRDKLPAGEIKNLWYKKNGQVIKNDLRFPVDDLDKLPLPDKDLFKDALRFRDDYMLLTSRGCPYSCSYCCESYFNKIYKGRYFRRRSIYSVIDELKVMRQRYRFKRVTFFDSILFTDERWLRDFLKEYKKEISLPFRSIGHVNFASYEIIKSLKDAGCYAIDFGVQTFNEGVRKDILCRPETNEQIKKAFSICDNLKLRYDVDLMFGLPKASEEDYRMPIYFMSKSKYLNRLKCYYLSYFPKLSIIDKARGLGILEDKDINDIESGRIGDWFHLDSIKDKKHKKLKEDFQKLYKIFPIIPFSLRSAILKHRIYRFFHLIPNILVIFIQLIIGISKRDYRFKIYINNYVFNLKKRLS
jgi:radical SAM superfamily enzyme YgiQ (UPF0313 family)